jgi:hypothetical protein
MISMRMIIGMATSLNSEVENMDVNKTFLHGELEEKNLDGAS